MATTWLEMTVGVLLVLFSIAMVILFIFLCWGITWKLLLSRLGLFKELFSNNNNNSGSHANKTTTDSSKSERSRGITKPHSSSRGYHGQQQHQKSSGRNPRTDLSETKKRVTIATSELQSERSSGHTDHDTGLLSETSKDA